MERKKGEKFETGEASNSKRSGRAKDHLHVIYNCA